MWVDYLKINLIFTCWVALLKEVVSWWLIIRSCVNFSVVRRRPNELVQHQSDQSVKNKSLGRNVEALLMDTEAVKGAYIDDHH